MLNKMYKSFDEFLEEKFADGRADGTVTKDNYMSKLESWLEQLDVQELIDFGEEHGKYCYEIGLKNGVIN